MGAWGTGPMGNDDAADWAYVIAPDIRRAVEQVLDDYEGQPTDPMRINRLRAAAWVYSQLNDNYFWDNDYDTPEEERVPARLAAAYRRILSEGKYIKTWRVPDEIRDQLEAEYKAIMTLQNAGGWD